MGMLDQLAEKWFVACDKFVADELGKDIHLQRSAVGSRSFTRLCIPAGRGDVRCFNLGTRTWDVMEDDDMYVHVFHDGTVDVGYSLMEQAEEGMSFKVGHPREVSELFTLLTNPARHMNAGSDVPYGRRKYGDIAEFHVLIADEATWRIMDPANLPPETPADFRKALYSGVVRDWDHNIPLSESAIAWQASSRWQEYLKTLPLAAPLTQAGYFLDPYGNARSAVGHAELPPSTRMTTCDLLMAPRRSKVSSLYLREYLNGDKEASKKVQGAFAMGEDLQTLMERLGSLEFLIPVDIRQQVRIAAEHNAIRKWLISICERMANQRGCFFAMADKHWHLAHALGELLDREQIEA